MIDDSIHESRDYHANENHSQPPTRRSPRFLRRLRTVPALRILATIVFNLVVYLTLGLPLAVLPTAVRGTLGYGPVLAGLAVSLQYLGTLLSRPSAGRMVDGRGPKHAVVWGLAAACGAGLFLVAASLVASRPPLALGLIAASRLLAGFAESWASTGAIMWTIGRLGSSRTGQIISWNGITSYGGLAIGAPIGVALAGSRGLGAIGVVVALIAGSGLLAALPRAPTRAAGGERLGFASVFWRVTPLGTALGLGSFGFGVIASFVALFYASRGWDHPAVMLTVFGGCFILCRLLFAGRIAALGGLRVSSVCFAVEAVGLALVGLAHGVPLVLAGGALAGFGFALVFPALGVEAVQRVDPANRGAALGAYSLFADLALGASGPIGGAIAEHAGYAPVFLFAAAASLAALALVRALARAGHPDRHRKNT